ncbi:MAG: hypothetical protein ACRC6D_08590 [Aeromonas sp.]
MHQKDILNVTNTLSDTKHNILQHLSSITPPMLTEVALPLPNLRLMKVEEINDEKTIAYRSALANVYATLECEAGVQFVYLLDCGLDGVSLYFGVSQLQPQADGHEALKNFRGALEGQLPGINLSTLDDHQTVITHLQQSRYQGVVLGVPTGQSEEQGQ